MFNFEDEDSGHREDARGRQHAAASAGRRLPSVPELVLGSPWFRDELSADSQRWVERTQDQLAHAEADPEAEGDYAAVRAALRDLAGDQHTGRRYLAAARILRGEQELADRAATQAPVPFAEHARRCDYYAASLGEPEACLRTAQHALELAALPEHAEDRADLAEAALGWLAVSRHEYASCRARQRARQEGFELATAIVGGAAAAEIMVDTSPSGSAEGVVVLPSIGSTGTQEGKRVLAAYGSAVGVRMPLVPMPDLASVREALVARCPHAVPVIDRILGDLVGREHVALRPTLLVGEPGSGKTSFACRLLDELGIRHQVFGCGGIADGTLQGISRTWMTGTAAMPVQFAVDYSTASPGIVLDELEKVGSGRQNGSLHDALLSLLEPTTARRWRDQYLQAECDLSRVLWLATANDLEGIPAALKDRFQVLRFPSPTRDHLEQLAPTMLRRAVSDSGLDPRWALPLDGVELEALLDAWPGGSLRSLRRLVEGVLAARDQGFRPV